MSTLKADTIVASDGSSPVALTKQEAAKSWFQANLETPAVEQSLNISSITDVQGGRHDFAFSNNFAARTYACLAGGGGSTSNNTLANVATPTDGKLTSRVRADTQYAHMNVFDPSECAIASIGGLA